MLRRAAPWVIRNGFSPPGSGGAQPPTLPGLCWISFRLKTSLNPLPLKVRHLVPTARTSFLAQRCTVDDRCNRRSAGGRLLGAVEERTPPYGTGIGNRRPVLPGQRPQGAQHVV